MQCRYSFMLPSKMLALCPNPSTIWAIVYVICLLSLMLRAHVTCSIWYVVCFICNVSWSIYDISIMFCSMYETFYVVSKNTFVCFNWFVKWAKIAHSVSTFSLQCCICKIIHLCSRFFMLLGKNICGILRFNFWPLLLSYF